MQAMATPWPSDGMRPVLLTGKQFQNLTAYLEASFARDDTGAPIQIVGEHYNAFDEFYAANGRYSAFTTCNEWARRGLAAAGIEMPLWAPFATAIFRWLPIRAHSG